MNIGKAKVQQRMTITERLMTQSLAMDAGDGNKALQAAVGNFIKSNLTIASRMDYLQGEPKKDKKDAPKKQKKATPSATPKFTFGGEPKKAPGKPKKDEGDRVVVKS
jgi:hypothetical protein